MAEINHMVQGRIAELRVAAKLLAEGHVVFAPLVDDCGIDLLIRRLDGSVDEIQVKSVASGRWFQVQERNEPQKAARARRWVVCVEPSGSTWVFPSKVFFDPNVSGASPNGKGIYTYDLNLDVTRKGAPKKNEELLAEYREAWGQLKHDA